MKYVKRKQKKKGKVENGKGNEPKTRPLLASTIPITQSFNAHSGRILDPIMLPFDYSRKYVFSSQESRALYSVKKDHSWGLRLKEREREKA